MKFTDNLHFDEETIEFFEEFLEGFHAKHLRVVQLSELSPQLLLVLFRA